MHPAQFPAAPVLPPKPKRPVPPVLIVLAVLSLVGVLCGGVWLFGSLVEPHRTPAADDPVAAAAPSSVGPAADQTAAFRSWLPSVPLDPADFAMVTAVRLDAHGYGISVETDLFPKSANEATAVRLCQVAGMYALGELGGFRTVWVGDQAGNVLVSRREVGGTCDWRR
jgi:hypothetical protein